jgi:hypothetical protein
VFCQSKGKIINPQSAGWTRFLDFANRNPEGHIHIIGLRGVRGGFMLYTRVDRKFFFTVSRQSVGQDFGASLGLW